jgi:hypothetical protein
MTREDFAILRVGRHFRLSPTVKLIVGRDEMENAILSEFSSGRWRIEFPDIPSPLALVEGAPTEEDLELALRIAARYADVRPGERACAVLSWNGEERELWVEPLASDGLRLSELRIGG